jgi:hypothetical protein
MKKTLLVLLFAFINLTVLKAQSEELKSKYPDLKVMQVISDSAAYYGSPKSQKVMGYFKKGKRLFSGKEYNGFEVIVEENGKYFAYMKPTDFKILYTSTAVKNYSVQNVQNLNTVHPDSLSVNEILYELVQVQKQNEKNLRTIKNIYVGFTIAIIASVGLGVLVSIMYLSK